MKRERGIENGRSIRKIIPADELETVNDNIGPPIAINLGYIATDNVNSGDVGIRVSRAAALLRQRSKRRCLDGYESCLLLRNPTPKAGSGRGGRVTINLGAAECSSYGASRAWTSSVTASWLGAMAEA